VPTVDVRLAPRRIQAVGTLQVRAGADGDRIIEGRIVPFGVVSTVQDRDAVTGRPVGRPYRETIAGVAEWDPTAIVLENGGHRGPIAGRGIEGRADQGGADVAFRMLGTAAGNDAYELAREGLIGPLSIEIDPSSPSTPRADGVMERMAVIRRVAIVERGAYPGAEITAVRADMEGEMPDETQGGQAGTPETEAGAETPETATQAPAAAAGNGHLLEVRTPGGVTIQARAEAERAAAATLTRSHVGAPIRITRDALVYGPDSGRSFLRDLILAREGDGEAQDAQRRHDLMLRDVAVQIERSARMERAGDVLSSEIPGAYPNTYLPGLLTPRILKGRPMGGFYNRIPISDARPQIFAKVTTSTSVAVQSAEGANPAASDFATTAVTATPLLYGAETVVSRQVIDGASPGAEAMVIQDMVEAYAQASETVIKTAVEAGSSASGVAITAATPYAGTQGNAVGYYATRFKPAHAQFIPSALYSVLLAELDTTGRPKMPNINPSNSNAITDDGGTGGAILGAQTYLSYASTANVVVTGREDDFVIFESSVARFSYDAVTGPSGVRLGIWAYLVVGARLGSLKVTAA
jgi:hypothetical protein